MSESLTITRRDLLRGVALFLGAGSLGLSAAVGGIGCTPTPPEELVALSGVARSLKSAWRPPESLIRVGEVVVREHRELTRDVIALSEKLNALLNDITTLDQPDDRSKAIAQHLHRLHLESTQRGEWVEVSGWRLSRIEASAYGLVALSQT